MRKAMPNKRFYGNGERIYVSPQSPAVSAKGGFSAVAKIGRWFLDIHFTTPSSPNFTGCLLLERPCLDEV